MMDKGCLVISLDFELLWGGLDIWTPEDYGRSHVAHVREAIHRMVALFKKYEAHATFATVGFLMLEDTKEIKVKKPEHCPSYQNEQLNPYGPILDTIRPKSANMYFAPDVIKDLQSQPFIEIGTHTFSHFYCWEDGQTLEQFEADIQLAVEVAKEKGITLESIVFPRNQVSKTYLEICKKYGILSYRGNARKYFDVDSIDTTKYDWHIDTIEPAGREFCLTINRVFMSDYLKKIHEDYAKKNGTPALLDFELEAYNEAGIWLAKKKYIKNMTWAEPNVYYESCSKIKATGVEIAQTSSSQWVKNQLTDLVKWIFQQEEFVLDSFVKKLAGVKKQFMLQSPETISVNKAMNKYNDYVFSDVGTIEMNQKPMNTIQGAALYNYILNSNEKFKKRYSVLFDADKLCMVYIKPTQKYQYWKKENQVSVKDYVKNPENYKLISEKKQETRFGDVYTDVMSLNQCEAFSYPAGMFPMDMAANFEIDKNRMFDLLVLGPVNRIVEAMGYQPIDISMTTETGLW